MLLVGFLSSLLPLSSDSIPGLIFINHIPGFFSEEKIINKSYDSLIFKTKKKTKHRSTYNQNWISRNSSIFCLAKSQKNLAKDAQNLQISEYTVILSLSE
jgi:hypothetical protein